MEDILNIITILLAVVLTALILMQVKGSGGGLFGQSYSTNFQTRRGFAQTLFRATILLTVVFIVLALTSARLID